MAILKNLLSMLAFVAIIAIPVACDDAQPEPTPTPDDPIINEDPANTEEEPELPELTETIQTPEIQIKSRKMVLSEEEKNISAATSKFALNMFSEMISDTGTTENMMFSPLSTSLATSLVANGTAGNTYFQIAETLGFSGMDIKQINEYNYKLINGLPILHDEMKVSFANAIFAIPRMKIFPNFLQRLDIYYDVELFQENFTATDVNNWVNNKTNGLITKIIEDNEEFDFAMINALNFAGTWREAFIVLDDKSNFRNADGSSTALNMLRKQSMFYYAEFPNFNFISIPYKLDNFRLNILHPSEDVELGNIVSDINSIGWETAKSSLKYSDIILTLPSFKVENNISIKDYLISIGIRDLYDKELANFAEMTYFKPTYITESKQSNFFKLDEEGTISSSATIHEGATGDATSVLPTCNIDSRFIFIVTEESSGAILFMGCINKL